MLLAASAGYDPRVAPKALRMMKRDFKGNDALLFLLEERIKFMAQPEVMQEAVSIYEKTMKKQGIV